MSQLFNARTPMSPFLAGKYSTGSFQGPTQEYQNVDQFRKTGQDPVFQGPVNKGGNEKQLRQTGNDGTGGVLGAATTYGGGGGNSGGGNRGSGGGGNNNIGGQENVDWYTNEFGQRVAIDKGGPSQEDLMREVDGVYGESYGYLDNVEGQLRQDFPNVLQEAESQFKTNTSMLGNQRQSGLNQLQGQEETTQNRQMDALAEARRLYDSLMRGYNQRFGGATSAGGAASEIAAVEQQRQQGGINRDARQTMRQIEVARGEVENNYQTGLLQLEQQKQTALNQANRDFQNKLLEVNRMRSELGQNKAQMRLQALQELRAQAFQIEAENRQFAKQLEMMKRESEISLQNYARQLQMSGQGSQGAVNNFMGQQYAPTQDLKVGGGGQFGGNSPAMTGQISRDDEMFGQISPMRRDEQYF